MPKLDISSPTNSALGRKIGKYWYSNSMMDKFANVEIVGCPHHGGEHTMSIKGNLSDIRQFIHMFEKTYGRSPVLHMAYQAAKHKGGVVKLRTLIRENQELITDKEIVRKLEHLSKAPRRISHILETCKEMIGPLHVWADQNAFILSDLTRVPLNREPYIPATVKKEWMSVMVTEDYFKRHLDILKQGASIIVVVQ